jgi:hypothetical protein
LNLLERRQVTGSLDVHDDRPDRDWTTEFVAVAVIVDGPAAPE